MATNKSDDKNNYYYADTEEVIEIHYDKNGNEIGRDIYRRPLSDKSISKDRILYLSGKKSADGSAMGAGEQSAEIIKEMKELDKKNRIFNKKLDQAKDIAINNAKSVASVLQVWMGTSDLQQQQQ